MRGVTWRECLRAWTSRHGRSRQRRHGAPASSDGPAGLQRLTDRELARAWDHTARALEDIRDPGRRLGVVITRQHLLDEAWRRNRHELERWVSSAAPDDDGNDRYVDPHW